MDVDSDFCAPSTSRQELPIPKNRSDSPEPSTSAGFSPFSILKGIPDHIYKQIHGLQNVTQLRGQGAGRRRCRTRAFNKTKQALLKYAEAVSLLEPMVQEEIIRQTEAEKLIAATIEHFANTVNGIADKIEGKELQRDYEAKIENFKKRQEKVKAKLKVVRGEDCNLSGDDDKEEEYGLETKAEAAVEALSCAEKKKQVIRDLFEMNADEIQQLIMSKMDK